MNSINMISKIPFLYHFTDRRNLPLIRQHGGLLPMSELRNKGVQVPAPGGNEWSQDADAQKGMQNFVHLCFRNNHPMEFLARQDGRISDSIFLRIHASILNFDGVKFTQDVANKSGVVQVPIGEACGLIDFEVLYTRTNWSDPAIQERLKQAEKYEVLVPTLIPLSLIGNMENG
jgi:ssDNA thymidine ADP-ribosyltransferase, DarT